jgi:alpha-tubulin suppressor-like RCC1 family protein
MMRPVFATLLFSAAALAACNLIVGVHDVKLRKDSGSRDGDIDPIPPEDEEAGPEPERVTQLALGKYHSCIKRLNNQVRCWGDDSSGQTGTGGRASTANDAGLKVVTTATMLDNANAVALASGAQHSCFVQPDGSVSCFGANVSGQLGTGSSTPQSSPSPARNVVDAISIAAGSSHTCVLRRTRQMACWGLNGTGQLGTGNFASTNVPVDVLDVTDVKAIAAGQSHTCAVTLAGDVFCWGENFNGQLGLTPGGREAIPRKAAATNAIAIAASNDSTCAVLGTGGVVCWGKDDLGQTGRGVAGSGKGGTPVQVTGVEGAVAVSGGAEHFCALTSRGSVLCWGDNRFGQLGQGARSDAGDAGMATIGRPTVVAGITGTVTSVGAGGDHSCAATSDEAVYCWGDNGRSELGDGTDKRLSAVPVAVSGVP